MASTTSDKRVVRVALSNAELTNMLGEKALAAGFIDFTPDYVELVNNGDGWEAVFELSAGAPA